MYKSLIDWACFPITIHPKGTTDASGDIIPGTAVVKYGYPVDNVVAITDSTGQHYVSMTQIYFPPEVNLTMDDMLETGDGNKYKIRKLGGFYDSEEKALSIKVVYL